MSNLSFELSEAVKASDSLEKQASIAESLAESGAGIEAVSVILKFMEEHPSCDFGAPGPLTHFAETFYKRGYERELLASVGRLPTSHTVWLLNRILNGTRESEIRKAYIQTLRSATEHPKADLPTKKLAEQLLLRLSEEDNN